MSHFYGTLEGSRGPATRCGTKSSGLTVTAASWSGAIQVHLWVDEHGRDRFSVEQIPWHGAGCGNTLAEGHVGVIPGP